MNVTVENALRAPAAAKAAQGLRRGRTRILATGDVVMLVIAYAATYAIADRIAPLPPVSAPDVVPRARRR